MTRPSRQPRRREILAVRGQKGASMFVIVSARVLYGAIPWTLPFPIGGFE